MNCNRCDKPIKQGQKYHRTPKGPHHADCGNMLPQTIEIPNPEESWARIELFRWQYGTLPQSNDMRKLNVTAGLQGMADAIEIACKQGNADKLPTPFNVVCVLRFVAKLLEIY